MIRGVGVDIVDVARFERALQRTPRLAGRLFASAELGRSSASLGARFAAKEALIKAIGDSAGLGWQDMVIESDEHGNPSFVIAGRIAAVLAERGIDQVHLSMSHDAGLACAFVVAEATG